MGSFESQSYSSLFQVLEAIVSQRLITKVWDKTILPAENVCEILREHLDCQTIFNRQGFVFIPFIFPLSECFLFFFLNNLNNLLSWFQTWIAT